MSECRYVQKFVGIFFAYNKKSRMATFIEAIAQEIRNQTNTDKYRVAAL